MNNLVNDYLTESNLINWLNLIFPDVNDWKHNKVLPGTPFKPDYYSDELKLVVEYNGPIHYTDPNVISQDYIKYSVFEDLGYKVVELPYFVQLDKEVIKYLFKVDSNYESNYPQGWVDTAVFPAAYCSLGINRLYHNLFQYKGMKLQELLLDSLLNKIKSGTPAHLVVNTYFMHDLIGHSIIHWELDKQRKFQLFEDTLGKESILKSTEDVSCI